MPHDDHVRRDAVMLVSKQLARAAEPGLDLIADEEHVVFAADRGDLGEIACRRNDDTGLALDGLDQKGGGVGRNGSPQRFGVSEWNAAKSGCKRSKPVTVLRLGGKTDHTDGAAMEVAGNR